MICLTFTALICVVLVYIYYKGWKVEKVEATTKKSCQALNLNSGYLFLDLWYFAVGALFFSWNVGFTGFLVGSILIVLGCADEKKQFPQFHGM